MCCDCRNPYGRWDLGAHNCSREQAGDHASGSNQEPTSVLVLWLVFETRGSSSPGKKWHDNTNSWERGAIFGIALAAVPIGPLAELSGKNPTVEIKQSLQLAVAVEEPEVFAR